MNFLKELAPSITVFAICTAALGAVAFGLKLRQQQWDIPANLDWTAARNVPFDIRNGVEVAREDAGRTFASLSLVCSTKAEPHLLLLTRLPGELGFRRARPGRDDVAYVSAGENFRNQLPIVADIVAIGESDPPEASDRLETIVTPALSRESLMTLAGWFGDSPPAEVSVVGIDETGVFMTGTRDGRAIREFAESCAMAR